jgi:transcriptional regulator with XRE-family HTH domain
MLTVGQRIIKLREQKGLRQSELARLANISLSTLNMVERGVRDGEGLSVGTAKKIARALGVTLDAQFIGLCSSLK